jgi:photosystem II stability/assembly factor-like uncharacterized protein
MLKPLEGGGGTVYRWQERGWIAGDLGGTLLRTINRGLLWSAVDVPALRTTVRRLFFEPTRGLGWAAGHNGTLLRSSDGGGTWTPLDTCTGISHLTDVTVDLETRRGFATSDAGVNCWSSDAGALPSRAPGRQRLTQGVTTHARPLIHALHLNRPFFRGFPARTEDP